MMYLGFLLLAIAVATVVVGFLQRGKMKRILAAPFAKTGQALTAADGQGQVSFQGTVQPAQQLFAPVSGQPCLYYEIEIKQEWEKHVQTEDGSKKETGTDTAHEDKAGSMFYVNDGSGPVAVNATEGVDAKLEKTFDEKKSYGWGDISFGNYHAHINRPSDGAKHATATRCIEKIIPASGDIFVLGKVAGNVVQKRDGMLGKLMLAREGRDGLLGSTKRNMVIAFAAAGLLVPAGGAMAIFGEAPEAAADTCAEMKNDIEKPCVGRVHDDDVTFKWKVTEEADYTFSAKGTGKDTTLRLWPSIEVEKDGEVVFTLDDSGPDGVEGTHHFEEGTYTITINDVSEGHADKLKGGAGFELEIDQVEGTKKESDDEESDESDEADEEAAEGNTVAAKADDQPSTVKPKTTKSLVDKGEKAEEKVEAKTEDKVEEKTEDKAEDKAEEKVEAKAEEKAEEKVEAKAEDKPEPPKADDGAKGGRPRLRLPAKQ